MTNELPVMTTEQEETLNNIKKKYIGTFKRLNGNEFRFEKRWEMKSFFNLCLFRFVIDLAESKSNSDHIPCICDEAYEYIESVLGFSIDSVIGNIKNIKDPIDYHKASFDTIGWFQSLPDSLKNTIEFKVSYLIFASFFFDKSHKFHLLEDISVFCQLKMFITEADGTNIMLEVEQNYSNLEYYILCNYR